MSLIRFIFKTDALLGCLPLFFLWGGAYQFLDKEPAAGWAFFFGGAILSAIILTKKAQHMRILNRRDCISYIREVIHANNTYPFRLPSEADAMEEMARRFDNPLP